MEWMKQMDQMLDQYRTASPTQAPATVHNDFVGSPRPPPAKEAEKRDPSVVDRVSDVFAEQPQLLKILGGAALAIALGRMAQKRNTL